LIFLVHAAVADLKETHFGGVALEEYPIEAKNKSK